MSDATSVAQLQPLLALLASIAASSSKTSKMISSELVQPLTHSLMVTASQQQLSAAQGRVLAELAPSLTSSGGCVAQDLSRKVISSALSRTLATGPELNAENADVAVVQGLLSCGLVPLSHAAQLLLSQLLCSAESKDAAKLLMKAGHTAASFVEACVSVQQSVCMDQMACSCELLTLFLEKHTAGQVSADSDGAFETLLLLCFGTLLQNKHDGCSKLLASSAVPTLQNSTNFSDARGLLYMITVALQAAAEVPSDASCQAASRIIPCTVLCLGSDHAQPDDAAASEALQAFKTKALPLIFELAVPVLAGASQVCSLPTDECHLRQEAATFWRTSRSLVHTCAPSDVVALMPVLMHKLLANWDAEQKLYADAPDSEAEDGQQALRKLCSGAAGRAPEAVELLKLARTADSSVESTLLQHLTAAAFSPPTRQAQPDTAAGDSSSSSVQHMVLFVCAVLLRIDDAQLLSSALSSCVQRYAVEIAAVELSVDAGPESSILAALLQHAAATLASDEVVLQISSLLRHLWNELQAEKTSDRGNLCLTALLAAVSSLPQIAAAAVAEFFSTVAVESAEQLCTGDQALAAQTCQIVTVVAPQVQACVVPGDSVSDSRDSFAVKVLAWLCQRPPMLSRDQATDASGHDASAEASAMLAVASLFMPRPLHEATAVTRTDPQMLYIRLLSGTSEPGSESEPAQKEQHEHGKHGSDAHGPSTTGEVQKGESEAGQVAVSVAEQVQQSFNSALAHQLRSARVPGSNTGPKLQELEQDALQQLFLAAYSTASTLLSAVSLERLERYLEEQVSVATVVVEQHCEAMCEALLNTTRELASLGDTVEPKECTEIALQLSWSKPAVVCARLLGGVQQAAEAQLKEAGGLQPTTCELFSHLCKISAMQKDATGRSESLEHIERLVVRLLLCYGACMHIARLLEEDQEAVVWDAWVPGSAEFWHTVAQAALLHVSDRSIETAAEEFDAWAAAELGVPAVQAAVGVLQCDAGSACMHAAATRIALHPSVLFGVVKQNIGEYAASPAAPVCILLSCFRRVCLKLCASIVCVPAYIT